MNSPVQMYLRVRLADGTYPYLKPAYASNGRLRPYVAIHNGKATHFPDGTYYLRHQLGSKRVWELAGNDPSLALVNLQKKVHALQGAAIRLAEPVVASPPPAPVAKAEADPSKRLLADCAATYIAETTEHKSAKNLAAYRLIITAFSSLVKKEHIEDINREDLLSYIAALRKKGSSPRTIRNRIDHLQIFFHRFKIPSLLTGNDLPKYTEKRFGLTTRSKSPRCLVMRRRMSPTFSTSCFAPARGSRRPSTSAGRMLTLSGRHIYRHRASGPWVSTQRQGGGYTPDPRPAGPCAAGTKVSVPTHPPHLPWQAWKAKRPCVTDYQAACPSCGRELRPMREQGRKVVREVSRLSQRPSP